MIARVLEREIDVIRMSFEDAVDVVRGSVGPALRDPEGYGGMPSVFPNDVADRLRLLRAASDEAHREHQKKNDSAIDELERKAGGLYARF